MSKSYHTVSTVIKSCGGLALGKNTGEKIGRTGNKLMGQSKTGKLLINYHYQQDSLY